MSKLVAIMSMSLDGYIADLNDGVADVFDWYFTSGDVEIHTGGSDPGATAPRPGGEVLDLLENETGMHSCLDHKPSVAGWRRRQEEASPWSREYRPRSGQARSSTSC